MLRFATLLCLAAVPTLAQERTPVVGDDGLHKAPWLENTFKDLREDLATADEEGKRLLVLIEQRGCIYCTRMHEEVFVVPEIDDMLTEDFFVVQLNMFGDVEVTDFDGETLPEKAAVRKWGAMFTPTLMFFPEHAEDVAGDVPAAEAAVVTMPGAFGRWTTQNLLTWILEDGYETDEPFQRYHARRLEELGVTD